MEFSQHSIILEMHGGATLNRGVLRGRRLRAGDDLLSGICENPCLVLWVTCLKCGSYFPYIERCCQYGLCIIGNFASIFTIVNQ